jgi:hypothetical protein
MGGQIQKLNIGQIWSSLSVWWSKVDSHLELIICISKKYIDTKLTP